MIRNRQVIWFAWLPRWPTLFPMVVFLAGFGAIFAGIHFLGDESIWVWLLLLATLYVVLAGLHMLIAGWPVTRTLGITDESWPQAIGVGAVLGLLLGGAQLYRHISAGDLLTVPKLNLSLLTMFVSITLIVAGDEVLFRGWFAAVLEPAFGFVPTLLVSSVSYAMLPLTLWAIGKGLAGHALHAGRLYAPHHVGNRPAIRRGGVPFRNLPAYGKPVGQRHGQFHRALCLDFRLARHPSARRTRRADAGHCAGALDRCRVGYATVDCPGGGSATPVIAAWLHPRPFCTKLTSFALGCILGRCNL